MAKWDANVDIMAISACSSVLRLQVYPLLKAIRFLPNRHMKAVMTLNLGHKVRQQKSNVCTTLVRFFTSEI